MPSIWEHDAAETTDVVSVAPATFSPCIPCGAPPCAMDACLSVSDALAALCGPAADASHEAPGSKRALSSSGALTSLHKERRVSRADDDADELDALLAAAARKPVPCATAAAADAAAAAALPPALAAALTSYGAVHVGPGDAQGIASAASAFIARTGQADTFYMFDLGEVVRLHGAWLEAMPRIAPFYAVKCNPDPGVIAVLDALGAGFDCASIQELERAAALGVPQDRIIFANPCKRPADFRYAAARGVRTTTFDCACELDKIAASYPGFQCVLRIRCDDETSKINLGLKYGADLEDVPDLLAQAKRLGLEVVGVSFHVGSGCQNVSVYADAIAAARATFDAAAAAGFTNMHLLDIGGGFTAPHDADTAGLFYSTAAIINAAVDKHFPPSCGVRIIAEPGRYFAETSATLFNCILGQRESAGRALAPAPPASPEADDADSAVGPAPVVPLVDYWLSDGTYGSFRILVTVDGLEPMFTVLRSPLLPWTGDEAPTPCCLWGNSDRDGDCVQRLAMLPRLRNGDWLMYANAGAYTICSASNYGGVRMAEPRRLYVYSSAPQRDLGAWGCAKWAAVAGAAAVAAAGLAPLHACDVEGAAAAAVAGLQLRCSSECSAASEDSVVDLAPAVLLAAADGDTSINLHNASIGADGADGMSVSSGYDGDCGGACADAYASDGGSAVDVMDAYQQP